METESETGLKKHGQWHMLRDSEFFRQGKLFCIILKKGQV